MLLETAVEEGRCKGIETLFFCDPCSMKKPKEIAMSAPILFPEGHPAKKKLERIVLLPDDRQRFAVGV